MEFLKFLPNLKGENINKLNLKISVDQDAVSFSEKEVFTKCNGKCITIEGPFLPGKGEIPSDELTDCNCFKKKIIGIAATISCTC